MSMRKPLYFLHLPKTAGTSLRAYLVDQYSEQATFPKFDYRGFDADDLARLASYQLIIGHFDTRLLRGLKQRGYASALILREPVARTVSALRHAISDPHFRPPGVAMEGRALGEVIRDPEVMARFSNNQTGLLSTDGAVSIAQEAFPFDFDSIEPDLERALVNLARFDVVGSMEEFDASVLCLAWHCGLYPVKTVTRLNVAPSLPEAGLTPAEREIVASYNLLDGALYAAALARPRPAVPDRASVIASLPDDYFPPLDGADFLLRTPFCGHGFYRPDDIARSRSGRWTGPGELAGVTLRVPAGRRCLVYLEYFFAYGYATRVEFLLDGQPAAAQVCAVRGLQFARISCAPSGAGTRDIEIELRTDRVGRSEQDVRPRGLVLTGLRATLA